MNKLPDQWGRMTANERTRSVILIDGAMQRGIGLRLQSGRFDALSFFDRESEEARGLGAWLMEPATADKLGVDGIARGVVTWFSGEFSLQDAYRHLKPWVVQPFPDGVERGYLRVGDGRTLQALMEVVWTPRQKKAFCAPWKEICIADRDGVGKLLPCVDSSPAITSMARRLSATQYQALLDASVPDQLLHELKQHVRVHASLASRELRYRMAVSVMEAARRLAYTDPYDHMILIGWALRHGENTGDAIPELQAVQDGLHGERLWHALMTNADEEQTMTSALGDSVPLTEETE
ncbi:hypothetical protein K8O61_11770 [Xanthomonas cerealis pv. cerealis]|uniref:hypothetical protein n=1 Tax=Xanthomonas cerealis TaxID=3390025 RepID=UPI001F3A29E5|nr:hypothetical protein [Xanthomonas translucens]UKE68188.1 hypothetical protein K8O61_11770 [Xanthomonas translucens pv. pistacia]